MNFSLAMDRLRQVVNSVAHSHGISDLNQALHDALLSAEGEIASLKLRLETLEGHPVIRSAPAMPPASAQQLQPSPAPSSSRPAMDQTQADAGAP